MTSNQNHIPMEIDAEHDDFDISKGDSMIRIGNTYFSLSHLKNDVVWNRKYPLNDKSTGRYKLVFSRPTSMEQQIYAEVEESPIEIFNFVVENSLKNHYLLMRLANILTTKTIDRICEHVFTTPSIKHDFLCMFYELFLPIFLKRPYSWYTLNVIFRAKKAFPEIFHKLIIELCKDVNMSPYILEDFVCNMQPSYKKSFLKIVCDMNLDMFEFAHNIPCIYAAVKGSIIDDDIFQFILTSLETHSDYCIYKKPYGKLLLYLVENLSGRNVRFRIIQKVIDKHCSSYKNICSSMMTKYINELIADHLNMQATSRFKIPRPSDNSRL